MQPLNYSAFLYVHIYTTYTQYKEFQIWFFNLYIYAFILLRRRTLIFWNIKSLHHQVAKKNIYIYYIVIIKFEFVARYQFLIYIFVLNPCTFLYNIQGYGIFIPSVSLYTGFPATVNLFFFLCQINKPLKTTFKAEDLK